MNEDRVQARRSGREKVQAHVTINGLPNGKF